MTVDDLTMRLRVVADIQRIDELYKEISQLKIEIIHLIGDGLEFGIKMENFSLKKPRKTHLPLGKMGK